MNASLLLVAALLTADPGSGVLTQGTYYNADTLYEAAFRGQTPGQPTYADESLFADGPSSAFVPPESGPFGFNPFVGQPADALQNTPQELGLSYGAVGPQPYRFGWSSRFDFGFLPEEGVHGGGANGQFGVFEFNTEWRHTTGWHNDVMPQMIFSVTPEFDHRSWSGPSNPHLPANVYRLASDFELATPGNNPISYQLGFTPAFVSDLGSTPDSDSFNYDVRGVAFLRASPQLMVAVGAAFWNRVDNILIPYAGVVWTPSDQWEFRLMFPKSRISYFMGTPWGTPAWVYGGLEYNVEAYQIDLESPSGSKEKIQLADYRAVFGLRTEGRRATGCIEVGWVFDRQVDFLHGIPGFDVNTGFISRIGLRF
ncbi:MAG: hypothetical protein EXS05_07235 [Planctomycetaceae bacterium]|nr:hypothetical protein [Planctomycetaceae bacterium]